MATIQKRGNVYYSFFMARGKRIHKSLGINKAQAKIELAKLVHVYRNYRHWEEMSWVAFVQKFLDYRLANSKRETWYRDKLAFEYFNFPLKNISDVTPKALEQFQMKLKRDGKSNSNTNRLVRSIKTAMRKAEEWELIKPQLWRTVRNFKQPKGKLLFYTPEEATTLLARCNGPWKTVCLLGLRAGLRLSEMYYLRWEDISFNGNLLRITGKDGWEPKDYESRSIPMPKDLRAHLESIQKKSGWIIREDISSIDVMSAYFRKLVQKAGLKGSMHTLRHTYASHLVQAGVDLSEIKRVLGHSNQRTTEIYAHLRPDSFAGIENKLPLLGVAGGVRS